MGRIARRDEIPAGETHVYHVTSRCVRRAFLMGEDEIARECYDERRDWILRRLMRYARHFRIDVISFSILANHFHLVLRNRPDLVKGMSDEEVVRAIWEISPRCRKRDGSPGRLTPQQLQKLLQDKQHVARCRERLSSISWFMWYLKHPVAVWANAKDGRSGHFFEGRFRVTRMESLEQLLNTMIYNDLNPIRAGLARSIADSNYTSGQLRFHGRKIRQETAEMSPEEAERALTEFCEREKIHTLVDRWLSPVELREEDPILPLEAELLREQQEKAAMEAALVAAGFEAADIEAAMASETENAADAAIPAEPSASGLRASDRGVLPISEEKYLMLLDIMGRREKNGKSGKIPAELPPILSELGIETPEAWLKMYDAFAESIQEIYHGKVNDDREAAMVKLPLIDDRKTNQDAML